MRALRTGTIFTTLLVTLANAIPAPAPSATRNPQPYHLKVHSDNPELEGKYATPMAADEDSDRWDMVVWDSPSGTFSFGTDQFTMSWSDPHNGPDRQADLTVVQYGYDQRWFSVLKGGDQFAYSIDDDQLVVNTTNNWWACYVVLTSRWPNIYGCAEGYEPDLPRCDRIWIEPQPIWIDPPQPT